MKTTIELEFEQLESIVRQDLARMLSFLENDLEGVKKNTRGCVFSPDKDRDIKEIKKHIKSFKRILKYYGAEL